MRYVANPIYDVVFKYLLEDESVTVSLLSALLRKEVQDVSLRRNEYSDLTKQGVHLFRVDFAAHVREKDGSVHLVLIELQKSWVETEILRFRQYLGVQYSSPGNMIPREDRPESCGTGVPIVAVYILGHNVGDIEEPVLYVRRKYLDYEMNAVRKGVPDPFVESITHDSIIVQIPRLGTRQNNPLTRLLSIFDQSRKTADNRHILQIDETSYGRDALEQRILDRLTAAAADPDVRRIMMIEDEVLGLIARQDSRIAAAEEKVARQSAELARKDEQLSKKNGQIVTLVKMLINSGRTIDDVASFLGMTADDISQFLIG